MSNSKLQEAISFHRAGNLQQAEQVYRSILELEPNNADVNHNLGRIAVSQNQLETALPLFKLALEENPQQCQFWLSYIDALISLQQFELARDKLKQALLHDFNNEKLKEFAQILLEPHQLEIYKLATLANDENYVEAEKLASYLVENFPQTGFAWKVLGCAMYQLGRNKNDILQAMQKSVELLPNDADAISNLVALLLDTGDLINAEKHGKQAINIDKNWGFAYSNLGLVYVKSNKLEEGIEYYKKALELLPENADIHGNLGQHFLLMGDYQNGWKEFQWFYHPSATIKGKPPLPKDSKPQWKGESLEGKTILIYHEQGFGDDIQFIRFTELLKKRGAIVWVLAKPALANLLKTAIWVDRIVKHGDKGIFDFWSFPLQLPYWLETTIETIPCHVPYLSIDENKSAWWRIWLEKQIPIQHKRVGLVWAGNSLHLNDANRSLSFYQLSAFSGLENVTFVSLQLGEETQKKVRQGLDGLSILDASQFIQDFTDSAALLANLDVLITVDSAPAHLAGALNLPVWLMITKVPDWRWLLGHDDSPWYPSMKLFRQTEIGLWDSVLKNVKIALENFQPN